MNFLKRFLLTCLCTVSLSAHAGVYYNRFTTNSDSTQINGSNLVGMLFSGFATNNAIAATVYGLTNTGSGLALSPISATAFFMPSANGHATNSTLVSPTLASALFNTAVTFNVEIDQNGGFGNRFSGNNFTNDALGNVRTASLITGLITNTGMRTSGTITNTGLVTLGLYTNYNGEACFATNQNTYVANSSGCTNTNAMTFTFQLTIGQNASLVMYDVSGAPWSTNSESSTPVSFLSVDLAPGEFWRNTGSVVINGAHAKR